MTKAKTVGQRRRQGRPRSTGPRYDSGRAITQRETEMQVMRPVLLARCREIGLRPTDENLLRVRDQRVGSAWGKLWAAKIITIRQCSAVDEYFLAQRRYRKAIGAPSPFAGAPDYLGMPKGVSGEYSASEGITQRKLFEEADLALKAAGVDAVLAVDLLMDEPIRMPHNISHAALHVAAHALAAHFRLPNPKS